MERMNRAITFFGQIFLTFYETIELRAPPRKCCVAYACAPKRLLTLYNSVGRVQRAQTSHGAWIGFPIGDPWITRRSLSPWPFAFESVLPSQCPGIHPMHYFR
ncbi:hypothetical protein C4D60_Mb00t04680 [Musa balbisiana]|uniref:Uncharacterized protein n=1 Tax=Musa balbisiana TaxID=52838 RepID=A0A4S8I517_MUSBA|nr:hypothetical protein C4D60_Mb00t04680 [Musa balbisiana]